MKKALIGISILAVFAHGCSASDPESSTGSTAEQQTLAAPSLGEQLRRPGWDEPQFAYHGVNVAINAAGESAAVSVDYAYEWGDVRVHQYVSGEWRTMGFGEPGAFDPQVGIDDRGRILVTWAWRLPDDSLDLRTTSYDPTTRRWSTPVTIAHYAGGGFSSRLKMAPTGDALLAVWRQGEIWAIPYRPGIGWGPPSLLEAASNWEDVAVDEAGNGMVVWRSGISDNARAGIGTSYFTASTGTFSPRELPESRDNISQMPMVALSRQGAMVLWTGTANGVAQVYVNRYVNGRFTGAESLVPGWVLDRAITMSESGHATVAWAKPGDQGVYARRFNGSSWTLPERISLVGERIRLATTASGKTIAVWAERDAASGYRIVARRLHGSVWGERELVATDYRWDNVNWRVMELSTALSESQNVLVGWRASSSAPGGGYFALFNRFEPAPPPSGQPCGGSLGNCEVGSICLDVPNDGCDRSKLGADCPGYCKPRTCSMDGLECPQGSTCMDDPNDDCDPNTLGRECASICRPAGETG